MKSCWNTLPYFRPSATNVKKKLRGFFEAEAQPASYKILNFVTLLLIHLSKVI